MPRVEISSIEKNIGRRLSIARRHFGISRSEVARKSMVSLSALTEYECGRAALQAGPALRIIETTGINASFLMGEGALISEIRGRENLLRDLYPEYFTDNPPRKRFSVLWIESLKFEWGYRKQQGAATFTLRTYAESAGSLANLIPDLEKILTREKKSFGNSPAINFLQTVLEELKLLPNAGIRSEEPNRNNTD